MYRSRVSISRSLSSICCLAIILRASPRGSSQFGVIGAGSSPVAQAFIKYPFASLPLPADLRVTFVNLLDSSQRNRRASRTLVVLIPDLSTSCAMVGKAQPEPGSVNLISVRYTMKTREPRKGPSFKQKSIRSGSSKVGGGL